LRAQLGVSVLFFWPLTLVYTKAQRYPASARLQLRLDLHPWRLWLFAVLFALLTAAFLFVALRHGVFYHWFGNEQNLVALNRMNTWEFATYRFYGLSGLFMASLALVALLIARAGFRRWQTWPVAMLFFCLGIYIVRQSLNSRAQLIYTAMIGLSMAVSLNLRGLLQRRIRIDAVRVGFVIVIVAYLCSVVLNARVCYRLEGRLAARVLLPWSNRDLSHGLDTALRLNGIDLIARIAEGTSAGELAWGEAWYIPAYTLLYQLVDREAVQHYKETFEASPKKMLMDRYTSLRAIDYPSCVLTDIYGNFGWLGVGAASVVFGLVHAWITRLLWAPKHARDTALALLLMSSVVPFEAEALVVALGPLRILPLLGAMCLWPPFVLRVRNLAAPRSRQGLQWHPWARGGGARRPLTLTGGGERCHWR